jgi:hypothetical protein
VAKPLDCVVQSYVSQPAALSDLKTLETAEEFILTPAHIICRTCSPARPNQFTQAHQEPTGIATSPILCRRSSVESSRYGLPFQHWHRDHNGPGFRFRTGNVLSHLQFIPKIRPEYQTMADYDSKSECSFVSKASSFTEPDHFDTDESIKLEYPTRSKSCPFVQLPNDLHLIIIDLCRPNDFESLMLSCKTLYHAGRRYINDHGICKTWSPIVKTLPGVKVLGRNYVETDRPTQFFRHLLNTEVRRNSSESTLIALGSFAEMDTPVSFSYLGKFCHG